MEAEPAGGNDNREIEIFPKQTPPEEEEEMHCRMSPLSHLYPYMRENFPEPTKSSKRNEGTAEILEMLISMKKEMEVREKKWKRQQQIREECMEANFKRKEQQWNKT